MRRAAAVAIGTFLCLLGAAPASATTVAVTETAPIVAADDPDLCAKGDCLPDTEDLDQTDDMCVNIPDPGTPVDGVANTIDPGPENPASGQNAAYYDLYGYGPVQWNAVDLGCGPDFARQMMRGDSEESVSNTLANIGLALLTAAVAVVATITRWATTGLVDVFDPVVELATDTLGNALFIPLFPVVASLGLAMLVWRRRRATGDVLRQGVWWLLIATLGIAMIAAPLAIIHKVEDGITAVVDATDDALTPGNATASDTAIASLYNAVLYRTWQAGTFGRNESPTAEKYGPQLYAASGLTRMEQALPDKERQEITKKKRDNYGDIANKVQNEDPVAYSYLAGHNGTDRLGYAALGWFIFLCTAPPLVIAALMLLYAVLVLRVIFILGGAILLGSTLPGHHTRLRTTFNVVATAAVAAVAGGILSSAQMVLLTRLLDPTSGVSVWMVAGASAAVTIAAWHLWRRLRHVKEAVEQMHTAGDYTRDKYDRGSEWVGQQTSRLKQHDPRQAGWYQRWKDGGGVTATVTGAVKGAATAASGGPAAAAAGAARGAAAGAATAAAGAAASGGSGGALVPVYTPAREGPRTAPTYTDPDSGSTVYQVWTPDEWEAKVK